MSEESTEQQLEIPEVSAALSVGRSSFELDSQAVADVAAAAAAAAAVTSSEEVSYSPREEGDDDVVPEVSGDVVERTPTPSIDTGSDSVPPPNHEEELSPRSAEIQKDKKALAAARFQRNTSSSSTCPSCTKIVYPVEALAWFGQTWHKSCFSCGAGQTEGCKKSLTPTTCVRQSGRPYCKTCHHRLFTLKDHLAVSASSIGGHVPAVAQDLTTSATATEEIVMEGQGGAIIVQPAHVSIADRVKQITEKAELAKAVNNAPKKERRASVADKFRDPEFVTSSLNKCCACSKPVYLVEEVHSFGQIWHKSCFCCGGDGDTGCKRVLLDGAYRMIDGVAICNGCFNKSVGVGRVVVTRKKRVKSIVATAVSTSASTSAGGAEGGVDGSSEGVSVTADTTGAAESVGGGEGAEEEEYEEEEYEEGEEYEGGDAGGENQGEVDERDGSSGGGAEASAGGLPEPSPTTATPPPPTLAPPQAPPVLKFRAHKFHRSHDFDEKGILYWLGTKGHTVPYQNPHVSQAVVASMSSVYRGTVEYVVSRSATNGPNYTENALNSWMKVDFGPRRFVLPSSYTLRHGGASPGNALRSWRLQGKVSEADEWVTVSKHINDSRLSDEPNATASWEISLPENIMPRMSKSSSSSSSSSSGQGGAAEGEKSVPLFGFRYLRICQFDKNSNNNNCLFCSGMEFYGVLYERVD